MSEPSVTYTFDEKHQCVIATLQGEFSLTAMLEYYRELNGEMEAHGCTRYLCDSREGHTTMEVSGIYDLPRLYEELGLSPSWRAALLVSKPVTANQRFWENVTTNRGHASRLFTNEQEALRWLSQG